MSKTRFAQIGCRSGNRSVYRLEIRLKKCGQFDNKNSAVRAVGDETGGSARIKTNMLARERGT